MHLAVLADDAARLVDQDRGVEMMRDPAFHRQLRKTEVEAYAELARAFEQRLSRRVRHLAFEMRVDVLLSVVVPVREEGSERAFREYHEVAAVRLGLPHQHDHACDRVRAA